MPRGRCCRGSIVHHRVVSRGAGVRPYTDAAAGTTFLCWVGGAALVMDAAGRVMRSSPAGAPGSPAAGAALGRRRKPMVTTMAPARNFIAAALLIGSASVVTPTFGDSA